MSEYCEFVTFQLRVYNRWGKLVFETNDPNEGWDGAIDGEAAPSEVYVYTLEYSFLDEDTLEEVSQMRKGDVTLLR